MHPKRDDYYQITISHDEMPIYEDLKRLRTMRRLSNPQDEADVAYLYVLLSHSFLSLFPFLWDSNDALDQMLLFRLHFGLAKSA